jgi:ankyrin repeat protein
MDYPESEDEELQPLVHAIFEEIEKGNVENTIELLEANPELRNCQASNQWTPVMFAARYGQLKILKYLIEKGCDIEN